MWKPRQLLLRLPGRRAAKYKDLSYVRCIQMVPLSDIAVVEQTWCGALTCRAAGSAIARLSTDTIEALRWKSASEGWESLASNVCKPHET